MDWSYLLFSFQGRISRKPFWIAFAAVVALESAAHVLAYGVQGERLSAIVDLAFSYPEFAICAKRGHDRNMPIWLVGSFFAIAVFMDFLVIIGLGGGVLNESNTPLFALTVLWMILGLVLLVDLGFRRGISGPNRFGPDPLSAGPRDQAT